METWVIILIILGIFILLLFIAAVIYFMWPKGSKKYSINKEGVCVPDNNGTFNEFNCGLYGLNSEGVCVPSATGKYKNDKCQSYSLKEYGDCVRDPNGIYQDSICFNGYKFTEYKITQENMGYGMFLKDKIVAILNLSRGGFISIKNGCVKNNYNYPFTISPECLFRVYTQNGNNGNNLTLQYLLTYPENNFLIANRTADGLGFDYLKLSDSGENVFTFETIPDYWDKKILRTKISVTVDKKYRLDGFLNSCNTQEITNGNEYDRFQIFYAELI